MPVVSNFTSCGSCLSFGYNWILHTSGVQDCWNETAGIDDLSHATEPGMSCADIFKDLGSSHWGIYAWIQIIVSIFIGIGFQGSFQVVYQRYGSYRQFNPEFAGFRGFFHFVFRFLCACFFRVAPLPLNHADAAESIGSLGSLTTTSTNVSLPSMHDQGTQTVDQDVPEVPGNLAGATTRTADPNAAGATTRAPDSDAAGATTRAPDPDAAGATTTAPDPDAAGATTRAPDSDAAGATTTVPDPEVSINEQETPPASTSRTRHHSFPETRDTSLLAVLPCSFPPPPPHPDDYPELYSPASSYRTTNTSPPQLSPASSPEPAQLTPPAGSPQQAPVTPPNTFCAPPRRAAAAASDKKTKALFKNKHA